jgi:hypothetical protein
VKAAERKSRTAAAYTQARNAADELIEKKSLTPLQSWYEDETGRVTSMLRREFKGRLKEKFAPQYLAPIRTRLETHFAGVATRLERKWAPGGAKLLAEGAQAQVDLVRQLSPKLERAGDGLVEKVVERHKAELERLRGDAARGFAREMSAQTWRGLRASFEAQTRPADLVVAAGELMDGQAWRLDRLVRTEASYGYNLAQAAALQAFPRDGDALVWGRWTERVDDASGAPLDKRVALDSLVLHGQVTRPGGVFTMPDDHRTPTGMAGKTWAHPPNRPNDRAVLLPWMRDWGVPGWILQSGRRIDLTRVDPGRLIGKML